LNVSSEDLFGEIGAVAKEWNNVRFPLHEPSQKYLLMKGFSSVAIASKSV
jgi:hypothetical protein